MTKKTTTLRDGSYDSPDEMYLPILASPSGPEGAVFLTPSLDQIKTRQPIGLQYRIPAYVEMKYHLVHKTHILYTVIQLSHNFHLCKKLFKALETSVKDKPIHADAS